jgi:Domain of unknown function (DUF4926)
MIGEPDLVVLKRDLPDERLAAGDGGTIVLVHQQGAGYEVEFATLSGDTVAVVTLDASEVRPAEAREIVHAGAVSWVAARAPPASSRYASHPQGRQRRGIRSRPEVWRRIRLRRRLSPLGTATCRVKEGGLYLRRRHTRNGALAGTKY